MESPTLTWLTITGDVSVEPVKTRIPRLPTPCLSLIMGPTGAGKSSFIEALAGESQMLSISKNQLAGYTQTVNAYRLVNVKSKSFIQPRDVYLIDTPGFSNSKISEVEIINTIRKWLEDNDFGLLHMVLFLTPITGTRLPGSRRRTMEMLKQFLVAPQGNIVPVTFVTTMWDTLHNEQIRHRAESNYAQMRDEVCPQMFGSTRVSLTRFMNTASSALEVIDVVGLYIDTFVRPTTSASEHLYQDLHERIANALREKQMMEWDLTQPDVQTDSDLKTILEKNRQENQDTLTKFIAQWVAFGCPPSHCAEAHKGLQGLIEDMQRASQPVRSNTSCILVVKRFFLRLTQKTKRREK
ncbi:hypothetical protein BJ165DRAFT_1535452 [Panaeolus papilionaceus]|nr:hypothetical protein BJ165DRAFT_1535452 [Panaeolus papilionaceus]